MLFQFPRLRSSELKHKCRQAIGKPRQWQKIVCHHPRGRRLHKIDVWLKVAMVKTLREFSVVKTANTPEKIVFLPEGFTTMSKDPLMVKMVRRKTWFRLHDKLMYSDSIPGKPGLITWLAVWTSNEIQWVLTTVQTACKVSVLSKLQRSGVTL